MGEHQQGRGANQIALIDFLKHKLRLNPRIQKIRLFSDSCVGQNKNFAMLAALMDFSERHHVTVDHVFPVRGHLYMPADRSFGHVEQILRRKETILMPEEYYAVFDEVGRVMRYPEDWQVYDYKAASDSV